VVFKIDKLYEKTPNSSLINIVLFIFLSVIYGFNEFRVPVEFALFIVIGFYAVRYNKSMVNGYFFWSLAIIFLSIFSLFYSFDIEQSLIEVRVLIQIVLIGNSIVLYVDTQKKLMKIYKYISAAGIALVIRLLITFPLSEWGSGRLGDNSLNLNPNNIGLYLAFSTIISLYLALYEKQKVYLVFSALFIVVIFLTGSRKALIVVIMGIIILLYNKEKNNKKKLKYLVLSLVILYLSYQLIINIPELYQILGWRVKANIDSFLYGQKADGSTEARKNLIVIAKDLFVQKPLLGYGVGSYSKISGQGRYSHNNFYELLVGLGLVGFISYYSLYLYLIYNFLKLRASRFLFPLYTILITLIISEYATVSYDVIVIQTIIAVMYAGIRIENKNFKLE